MRRDNRIGVYRACCGAFFLALLLSCSAVGGSHDNEKFFRLAVEAFNSSIRWEDYRQAALWLSPTLKERFWGEADDLQKQVRFTEFEIRDLTLSADKRTGEAVVRVQYYATRNSQLLTKTIKQHWHYLEKEKLWQLTDHGLETFINS